MKALLDTNVVFDAMTGRKGLDRSAQQIFELAANEKIDVYLSANTVSDIYYILKRQQGAVRAHEALSYIFSLFSIASVDDTDCYKAFSSDMDDFEDALLVECAIKAGLDVLVTGDKELLRAQTSIKIVPPSELI